MNNFEFKNPVKLVFGKGQIQTLPNLIPQNNKILLVFGKQSIKQNGVYQQVKSALSQYEVIEFGGVEPNPGYEDLIPAIETSKKQQIDFILAVGGGSVIDAAKFIAAAINYSGNDYWEILTGKNSAISKIIPLGVILTLPSAGSETNAWAVISNKQTQEKLSFFHPDLYAKFAILDPQTTYSLPKRQLINGIIDTFTHMTEQFITSNLNTPIQDGIAKTILSNLIKIAPKIINGEPEYNTRATWMLCASFALNGIPCMGCDEDWSAHMIGHELTALYKLDHAQTVAILAPKVWDYKRATKHEKLLQYAQEVWGIKDTNQEKAIDQAIQKTEEFFRSIGAKTKLSEYGIQCDSEEIAKRLTRHGMLPLGEHKDISAQDVINILS